MHFRDVLSHVLLDPANIIDIVEIPLPVKWYGGTWSDLTALAEFGTVPAHLFVCIRAGSRLFWYPAVREP